MIDLGFKYLRQFTALQVMVAREFEKTRGNWIKFAKVFRL